MVHSAVALCSAAHSSSSLRGQIGAVDVRGKSHSGRRYMQVRQAQMHTLQIGTCVVPGRMSAMLSETQLLSLAKVGAGVASCKTSWCSWHAHAYRPSKTP